MNRKLHKIVAYANILTALFLGIFAFLNLIFIYGGGFFGWFLVHIWPILLLPICVYLAIKLFGNSAETRQKYLYYGVSVPTIIFFILAIYLYSIQYWLVD